MDKASIIGDAIEYLEYLQERVRTLEELQTANETTESTVVVKKKSQMVDGDNSNTDEIRFPEIQARVCGKNVLLKIQCEKRKGLLGKILGEVDKLDLAVVNIAVAPFGSLTLDISIITKVKYNCDHNLFILIALWNCCGSNF
ncbi:transcription factor bhlh25 [Phtheirospermum japonicum]|uniref:Transcription factor bhlh25 n=1 Tax=Phtheirospermum japonicum TaxID=374723 RepID=A0A830C4M9_9LAMI|nr:transcription factor bhlh25 [Phtheirospermum japonicum]